LKLIKPYGGYLKELYLSAIDSSTEKVNIRDYPSWNMTSQQLRDIELLLSGAYSPLEGFMTQSDYESVLGDMRLANGIFWPVPLTFEVNQLFVEKIKAGSRIALLDETGVSIAVMVISEIWISNSEYQTGMIFHQTKRLKSDETKEEVYCLAGRVYGLEAPKYNQDPKWSRNSPAEQRALFQQLGWNSVVGFQLTNVMHRAHVEFASNITKQFRAHLLLQAMVGDVKPCDIDHFSRMRCYEYVIEELPDQSVMLNHLPISFSRIGPREAMCLAIVSRNYGCARVIIEQKHSRQESNLDFENPLILDESLKVIEKYKMELGVEIINFPKMVYLEKRGQFCPVNQVGNDEMAQYLSGDELKRRLRKGASIPSWFTYPKVLRELRKIHPSLSRMGFTVFLTGLSGSGKSTIANALTAKLMQIGERVITLLDGDVVRKHLSSELGFSKEHRNINILRIGYVASEITKNGGVAICAPIAPYTVTRRQVRDMIERLGGFVEVYVATPLETCEQRDRKGLYAKARAGLIREFTGISAPYEVPEKPEIKIDTRNCSPDEAAELIVVNLKKMGFIK
jgi:sulfate adenylyltransferase